MQTQALYDRSTAPTRTLTERESYRIATLGRNQIIYDWHKTQALKARGGERVTRLLPRPKKSLWRSIVDLIIGKQTRREFSR
jgi:hypothetical protein